MSEFELIISAAMVVCSLCAGIALGLGYKVRECEDLRAELKQAELKAKGDMQGAWREQLRQEVRANVNWLIGMREEALTKDAEQKAGLKLIKKEG